MALRENGGYVFESVSRFILKEKLKQTIEGLISLHLEELSDEPVNIKAYFIMDFKKEVVKYHCKVYSM
jgi:hypothetical protein